MQVGGNFHRQLTSRGKPYGRQQSVRWQRANTPLFLLKAQLVQGQATLKKDKGLQEHAWVLREEMPQYFAHPDTQELLRQVLAE